MDSKYFGEELILDRLQIGISYYPQMMERVAALHAQQGQRAIELAAQDVGDRRRILRGK